MDPELGRGAADEIRRRFAAVVDRELEVANRGMARHSEGQRAIPGEFKLSIIRHGAGDRIEFVVSQDRDEQEVLVIRNDISVRVSLRALEGLVSLAL